MRLWFAFLVAIGCRVASQPSGQPEEGRLTQLLDHFRPQEPRTWQQRYYVYKEHYKTNGPIFLLLGGDSPVDPDQLTNSFMAHLAKQFGAMCYLLEHRFYGHSEPTLEESTGSLVYLSIGQALADAARFIREMGQTGPWLVFGDSYAGSLAAWLRLKYPHLVHAAVADSAPLLAQADFKDYYAVAERLYRRHSPACADTLTYGLNIFYRFLTHASAHEKLRRMFNLCEPIRPVNLSRQDVTSLFIEILDMSTLPASESEGTPGLEEVCAVLVDQHRGPPLSRLANVFDLMLEAHGLSCLRLFDYADRLAELRRPGHSPERLGLRQMCAELGWFPTTGAYPFGTSDDLISLDFFEELCDDVFPGSRQTLHRGIERTNLVYGGRDLADVTSRTIFINGNDDPWSSFEILECDNSEIACIGIKDAGNCPLQHLPSDNDSPQILEAKKNVEKLIGKWLNQEK